MPSYRCGCKEMPRTTVQARGIISSGEIAVSFAPPSNRYSAALGVDRKDQLSAHPELPRFPPQRPVSMAPSRISVDPENYPLCPHSKDLPSGFDRANPSAHLARQTAHEVLDQRAVVTGSDGGVESINCTRGNCEKRSTHSSKLSNSSAFFCPCTSCTILPPIRSIEGISTATSRECPQSAIAVSNRRNELRPK